jgi:hypothetical protein
MAVPTSASAPTNIPCPAGSPTETMTAENGGAGYQQFDQEYQHFGQNTQHGLSDGADTGYDASRFHREPRAASREPRSAIRARAEMAERNGYYK